MHRLNLKILNLVVCLALAGCGRNQTLKIGDQDILALGPQDDCSFMMNVGLRVSWKSATPMRMVIHRDVPEAYDAAIVSAGQRWNAAFGRTLVEIARDNSADGPRSMDGISGIYWDTAWASGEANKQAWTWTSWEISKIKDADVRINAKDFVFFVDGDPAPAGKVHMESLIVHEIGHALGLSHNDGNKRSVMRVALRSGETRVEVGEPDIESLRCEY